VINFFNCSLIVFQLIGTHGRELCKTAEPIEMQFGMVQEICITPGCRHPMRRGTFAGVWPIEKHRKA